MNNPYSATQTVSDANQMEDDTYEPRLFTWNGRIGRLRYLSYGVAVYLLIAFFGGILSALVMPMLGGAGESAIIAVLALIYIPVLVAMMNLARRRMHDFNASGWLLLLFLVPLVNAILTFVLLIVPGSAGRNNFGPRPSANPWWAWLGLLFPFLFVGIIAAVAIPAYQTYVAKAKAAKLQQTAPPAEVGGATEPDRPGDK